MEGPNLFVSPDLLSVSRSRMPSMLPTPSTVSSFERRHCRLLPFFALNVIHAPVEGTLPIFIYLFV